VSSKENLVTGLRTLKMSIFIIIFQRQKFREISNEHTIFSARLWWNYSRQDRYNSIVPLSLKFTKSIAILTLFTREMSFIYQYFHHSLAKNIVAVQEMEVMFQSSYTCFG